MTLTTVSTTVLYCDLGIRSTSRLVDRIVDDYSTNEIVDSGSTSVNTMLALPRSLLSFSIAYAEHRVKHLLADSLSCIAPPELSL